MPTKSRHLLGFFLLNTTMNLYQLHTEPENLYGWQQRMRIPKFAYEEAYYRYEKTRKRFPDLESVIATDPEWAYVYANNVIKKRWLDIGKPEVESVIAKDPYWAYWYAAFVIKSRWSEAEPYIQQDSHWWSHYKKRFKIES